MHAASPSVTILDTQDRKKGRLLVYCIVFYRWGVGKRY